MSGASQWDPAYHAVSVVLRPDPGGKGATTISVRHPTVPYIADVDKGSDRWNLTSSDICGLVNDYLSRLLELSALQKIRELGFSVIAPGNSSSDDVEQFDCLPLADQATPWKTSFWLDRSYPGSDEHTLVILIAPRSLADEPLSKRGVRVVAHVGESPGTLLIASMSAYLKPGEVIQISPVTKKREVKTGGGPEYKHKVRLDVMAPKDPVSQVSKTNPDGGTHSLAMRRPTGNKEILDQYRSKFFVTENDFSDRNYVLHHPSEFARKDIDSGAVRDYLAHQCTGSKKGAPPVFQPLRSDDCSDHQAYFNANLLFYLFKQIGIRPESYFRSARLPLAVHYRSGMPYGPGKDGQTVNAAVQPGEKRCAGSTAAFPEDQEWRRHQIAPRVGQEPPPLHVHFALANRTHRGRKELKGYRRSPAEPMGIINDPRWVLHEFGHVLMMATTGELELRFAHSMGDALAAIIADPISDFVENDGDSREETEKKRRWRGVTFPWVYLPRRHDRSVKRGWSWSGSIHRPIRELPDSKLVRRKGYRSEQILSTSLFRLYLSLGGMTQGESGQGNREVASFYVVYLIIKGLALLGDARIVAANDPDQFVSALIDADIGTREFHLANADSLKGGFVHKVIRWAFEAQGLYADGAMDNNNKGEPPPVDVYIRDRRPRYEEWCDGVDHGEGSYVPVSLAWPESTYERDFPQWFSDAITINGTRVTVEVGNRGTETAEKVTVRVFYRLLDSDNRDDLSTSELEGRRWERADSKTIKDIPAQTSKQCGPFELSNLSEGSTYLILAEASCETDRANTDRSSKLPCSFEPMPLVHLVANDNNLGLTLWTYGKSGEKKLATENSAN